LLARWNPRHSSRENGRRKRRLWEEMSMTKRNQKEMKIFRRENINHICGRWAPNGS
jgi:hypothetical protein